MSSRTIKLELDNFDLDLLEVDEKVRFNELTRNYNTKRMALLEMIKSTNLSYYLDELRQIINEYDNQ